MSYVMAAPDSIAAAATDLAVVGSTVNAAHMAAASTTAVVPAADDEVSTAVANLFSGVGQEFHHLVGEAATFHTQFMEHLNTSAKSYAATEATAIASLKSTANTYVTGVNGFATSVINQALDIHTTLTQTLQQIAGVFELSVMVPYETLVLLYLTLALMIGVVELLMKYAGVAIPIP